MNEKYFLTSLHNSYQGRVLLRVTAEEDVLGGEDNMFFQLLLERSIFILVFTAVSPLLLSSGGKGRSSQNGMVCYSLTLLKRFRWIANQHELLKTLCGKYF